MQIIFTVKKAVFLSFSTFPKDCQIMIFSAEHFI
nr:MAG TPA: hypothetical protein [Caudoviricetes sp.]